MAPISIDSCCNNCTYKTVFAMTLILYGPDISVITGEHCTSISIFIFSACFFIN